MRRSKPRRGRRGRDLLNGHRGRHRASHAPQTARRALTPAAAFVVGLYTGWAACVWMWAGAEKDPA